MFKPWQVILFLLIVVLAVVGFIFWYYSTPNMGTVPVAEAPVAQQQVEQPKAPDPATITTDDQIDADLSGIDTQIQTADSQSAAVDQSLNDKPVAQTE